MTAGQRVLVGSALAAMLALYVLHAASFLDYVNDDAFITFRYARQLASGNGPYFNPGEHVEGYTSLLMLLISAAVIAIGGVGAVLPAAKAVGIAAGALSLLASYALCQTLLRESGAPRLQRRVCGLAAIGVVAAHPGFALNSVSGLETSLFAWLLTWGVLLGVKSAAGGTWRGAGLVMGLCFLARPETAALVAVYLGCQALCAWPWQRGAAGRATLSRHILPDGLVFIAVVAAQLVFRLLAYDGEWLPNTYFAKAGGWARVGAWAYIYDGLLGKAGAFCAAVAALGWSLRRVRARPALPVIAVGVTGALLPLVTGADWMLGGRFVVPYLPLLAVVAAVGCWQALDYLGSARRWVTVAGLAVLAGAPWLAQTGRGREMRHHIAVRARGYRDGHVALARYLHAQTKPGDAIALMDVGLVGYLCIDRRILDITGLTDRNIAKAPGALLRKTYDPTYVLRQKPRFVVLVFHGPSKAPQEAVVPWTGITARLARHPDFLRDYVGGQPGRVASTATAVRSFGHDYPDLRYLLVVFRRRPP